jgi:hypothetical protein
MDSLELFMHADCKYTRLTAYGQSENIHCLGVTFIRVLRKDHYNELRFIIQTGEVGCYLRYYSSIC